MHYTYKKVSKKEYDCFIESKNHNSRIKKGNFLGAGIIETLRIGRRGQVIAFEEYFQETDVTNFYIMR